MAEFENEDELPDDYPIYGNYFYVADGNLYMSDWHGITARELKARESIKKLCRCNIAARRRGLTITN